MEINLTSIGIAKGKQYETIVTTKNNDNTKNAAPIGIICTGKDTILCRIFKGSKTLQNILEKKEFIVNITKNPELFTLSTLGNLPEDYFNQNYSLKNADAYFKCRVISYKEAIKQSDPIKKNGQAIVIKSEVCDLVINKPASAFNRSLGYVIESLVNLTRFDIADEDMKKFYITQFRQAYRIVRKVGYKNEKEAMDEIRKEFIKKGYDI